MKTPEVREAKADELIDLRHRVLRTGLPRESAHFPGDDDAGTRHFAALDGATVVGCVTYMLNTHDGEPAWQLRGMATDPARQGKGVGRVLAEGACRLLAAEGPRLFWCNARTSAVGFYEKLGWTVCSEEFEIPGVGPHFKMWWRA